jgi:hypothetical protein
MELGYIVLIVIGALIVGGIIAYFWIMHKVKKLGEAIDKAMPKEETVEEKKQKEAEI